MTLNGHSQPTQVSRFGRVVRTLGYNGDGTLQYIENGPDDSDRATFQYYKLGVPQLISYADGGSESTQVSALGRSRRTPT